MPKRKKTHLEPKKPLDTLTPKRGRGRPGVRPSEIHGRGDHFRLLYGQIWNDVGEALGKAQTEEGVVKAFESWPNYQREFAPVAKLILKILCEPKFPRRRQPQINFLADSLAGWGRISPRRSRDICERERKERKKVNFITRRDFYIECTCRYKGPARHGKCPKCGTEELSLPYHVLR